MNVRLRPGRDSRKEEEEDNLPLTFHEERMEEEAAVLPWRDWIKVDLARKRKSSIPLLFQEEKKKEMAAIWHGLPAKKSQGKEKKRRLYTQEGKKEKRTGGYPAAGANPGIEKSFPCQGEGRRPPLPARTTIGKKKNL